MRDTGIVLIPLQLSASPVVAPTLASITVPRSAITRKGSVTKHYNKLVRDGSPGLIEQDSHIPDYDVPSPERSHEYLDDKMQEDFSKYRFTRHHVGLMDIIEVIQAIVESEGGDWDAFEQARADRRRERGGLSRPS